MRREERGPARPGGKSRAFSTERYESAISRREFMHHIYAHVLARRYIFFFLSFSLTIPLPLIISIWHSGILVAAIKIRLEQRKEMEGLGERREIGEGACKVYWLHRVSVRATDPLYYLFRRDS